MSMMNIEKRLVIDNKKLREDAYFPSLMQEACACGLISEAEAEGIQLACIKLLSYKCGRYSSGDSSSIRIETAESIMKSNLYTIGLYLKSLPDADSAAEELKKGDVSDMYQRGRELIDARLKAAKDLYRLTSKNRLATVNYTYNSTLSDKGIGSFFKQYDPDYAAHETAASIDYQLCITVDGLDGVEYIQRYLSRLYLENDFCSSFSPEDIHRLLSGYDKGYKDLLINIFERILTGAIGCRLAGREVKQLDVSRAEIQLIYNRLYVLEDSGFDAEIRKAAKGAMDELGIENTALRRYATKSLKTIIAHIRNAIVTDTLEKTIVAPLDPELKPAINFQPGRRMDNERYRQMLDELNTCRYLQDKLELIKGKVKSFGDFEDLLLDMELEEEDAWSVLELGGDLELAAILRHHPFASDIQAVELPERENKLRSWLRGYFLQMGDRRRSRIFELADRLVEE